MSSRFLIFLLPPPFLASFSVVLIAVILLLVAEHLGIHGHIVYLCPFPLSFHDEFFAAVAFIITGR